MSRDLNSVVLWTVMRRGAARRGAAQGPGEVWDRRNLVPAVVARSSVGWCVSGRNRTQGCRPRRSPTRIPAGAERPRDPSRAGRPLLAVATSVATPIPSNASNASSKPTNLDDFDADGSIYAPRTGLRALYVGPDIPRPAGATSTPARRPLLDQRGRAARRCGAAEIVRERWRNAAGAAAALVLATSERVASTGRVGCGVLAGVVIAVRAHCRSVLPRMHVDGEAGV